MLQWQLTRVWILVCQKMTVPSFLSFSCFFEFQYITVCTWYQPVTPSVRPLFVFSRVYMSKNIFLLETNFWFGSCQQSYQVNLLCVFTWLKFGARAGSFLVWHIESILLRLYFLSLNNSPWKYLFHVLGFPTCCPVCVSLCWDISCARCVHINVLI